MSCDGHNRSAHTVPAVMYGVGRGGGGGEGGGEGVPTVLVSQRERVLSAEAVTSVLV